MGFEIDQDTGALTEINHIDMTNNYWDSTSANAIAARIYDGNDDRDLKGFVDFEPFLDEPPLSEEKKSLGGFKAMFR